MSEKSTTPPEEERRVFTEKVSLSDVGSNRADFRKTTFMKGADFQKATFPNGADFEGAIFIEAADFSGVTFARRSSFRHTEFKATVLAVKCCFTFRLSGTGAIVCLIRPD